MVKVNDKVYDYILQEWGVVVDMEYLELFPIGVLFEYGTEAYKTNGNLQQHDKLPRLSLTKWNPITGEGKYTPIDQPQETEPTEIEKIWAAIEELKQSNTKVSEPQPPTREPQLGDTVWGWDIEGGMVVYGMLCDIDHKYGRPYKIKNAFWGHISFTRPHWIP